MPVPWALECPFSQACLDSHCAQAGHRASIKRAVSLQRHQQCHGGREVGGGGLRGHGPHGRSRPRAAH